MVTELKLGDVSVDVLFKDIKNVHLSVHPPSGRVRIAAPRQMSLEAVRLFAVSKIGWIRKHQRQFVSQEREPPREYLERESHYVWGRRYLLRLVVNGAHTRVAVSSKAIELSVPKDAPVEHRREVLEAWCREELRQKARVAIAKWEKALGVAPRRFFIQKMKTKWGGSNPSARTIRLNLDLVRFPPDCLDYVVLHELAHFLVPNHSEQFVALLDRHMPGWRTIRGRLNAGPLSEID
jgi:predicted metal-dependent hydrolase